LKLGNHWSPFRVVVVPRHALSIPNVGRKASPAERFFSTPVFPEEKQGSGPGRASANQALERTAMGRRSASAFCGYLSSLGGAGSGIQ
jgi:hypothetical protein